ncbi:hypothetical protein V8J88_23780 [Massilia sp. W12]|uniref:hypothetical protein n=1 Tax=Massilia sp. W12 TaxID=3126507 RepID=UPI0030CF79EA
MNFSGTYDTQGQTIMGLQGAAVPFSYSLRLDTALAGDPVHIAAGSATPHDWYGYSSDAIVSTNISFGTQTWDVSNLRESSPLEEAGIYDFAALWLNKQADQNPSSAYILLPSYSPNSQPVLLRIGELRTVNGSTTLLNSSYISETIDLENNISVSAHSNSFNFNPVPVPSPIPEAEQYLLMAGGLMALGLRLRRRKAA